MWIPALLFTVTSASFATPAKNAEVILPRGLYEPFFRDLGEKEIGVGPIAMQKYAATNADFRTFLKSHPEWRRSRVKKIFAEKTYLADWTGDLDFASGTGRRPVTGVSWFIARKYCAAQGGRLPTIAEWEYAADGRHPQVLQQILEWYGDRESKTVDVRRSSANSRGIHGMHGQTWEWVEDFSSVIMTGDSRSNNDTDRKMFCGAGSLKARDPAQYATFMRFAHRSSLKANMTSATLGFRCVREIDGQAPKEI